jgi:hypothetical protein
VIAPGWLPPLGPGRARTSVRPRALPYLRRKIVRRRIAAAPAEASVDTEDMLFDQGRELPVATVRRAPRSKLAMLAGGLSRWISTRWSWFRPRMVPVFVAFVGMLATVHAVSYLSGAPYEPAPAPAAAPVTVQIDEGLNDATADQTLEERTRQMAELLAPSHSHH